MTKGWTVWLKIGGGVLLALGGAALLAGFTPSTTYANPPPPFVTTSSGSTATTISTPTLPARLTLLAPAFTLAGRSGNLTVTYDWLPAGVSPLLAYRPDATSPWQKVHAQVDEVTRRIVVPAAPLGEYALVQVAALAALPGSAIVVDDQSAGFARYGPAGNWHHATYPASAYYLSHAYWTSNTYSTVENWGVWTPSTLNGPYEVRVFVPANYADTTYAAYRVQHAGHSDWRPVNQSLYWAEWVSLGVFTFTAGTESYVYLSDVTYEPYGKHWVAFDAVAFVPMRVYLPLVLRNWPPMKQWTGIHLGNHVNVTGDWPLTMLQPIDGDRGGVWPRAIVIQSKQLYNIWRPTSAPCGVAGADFWLGEGTNIRDYLNRAVRNGVTLIIRITPSAGNFVDWDDPARSNHHLITTTIPAGGDYCGGKWERFRAIDDVAAEMDAIHDRNQIVGWPESSYYFEPANEPNTEWYSAATQPAINDPVVWQEMNAYFVALYDYVHSHYPGIRVLTPPMAQTAYAEEINIEDQECSLMHVGEQSGYEYMRETYTAKNDGYSWHNYYWQGRESWANCPNGQHVSYFFPSWLQDALGSKPTFITEMDLASPWQMRGLNPLTNKDNGGGSPAATSLRAFVQNENYADVVIVWLLNNSEASRAEYDWHEASADNGTLRSWFTAWWPVEE